MPAVFAIFTYGTLKQGESNFGLLAPHARSIDVGWVHGRLYDVGDFPAMVEGDKRVHGEIVRLDPDELSQVLEVVDRLENCIPGDEAASMYVRRVVDVTTASGRQERAYAYFYNPAHPSLPALDLLPEAPAGEWHGSDAITHASGDAELDTYREWVRGFAERARRLTRTGYRKQQYESGENATTAAPDD